MNTGQFKKGFIPWNKGKKGLTIGWAKGKKFSTEYRKKISDGRKGIPAWNKGRSWSEKTRKKISNALLGQTSWNKGKAWSRESREKMRLAKLGKSNSTKGKPRPNSSGANHPNWQGGKTCLVHKIRCSLEYKKWHEAVLHRDKFSCVFCGFRSRKSKSSGYSECDIRVDHIKPFSLFPNLRFEISNGRTLCIPCDKIHGWNFKRNNQVK